MDKKYAITTWKVPRTALIIRDKLPQLLKSTTEDIAMYQRHISPEQMIISCEILESETFDSLSKNPKYSDLAILIEEKYEPNSFNAGLKERKITHKIIPRFPDDPLDLPWRIEFDHVEEEKNVNDTYNNICLKMYEEYVKTRDIDAKTAHEVKESPEVKASTDPTGETKSDGKLEPHKIYNSCCNIGCVNHVFGSRIDFYSSIREWVKILHSPNDLKKNIQTISDRQERVDEAVTRNSIYKARFYTIHVQKICEYCEEIFGANRFVVASYFEKVDPEVLMKNIKSENRGYRLILLSCIHAELGDYPNAVRTYEEALEAMEGPHGWGSGLQKLKDYYVKYGTTVLSSNL